MRALALFVSIGVWMSHASVFAQAAPAPPPQPYVPQAAPLPAQQPYPPQPQAPQTYPPQPYAPPYAAPQPYTPPAGYTYPQPAYGAVYAQPAVPGVPPDKAAGKLEPGEHRFSLVLSIVHPLVFSIYDASGEFRLGRHAGLAVVLGVGTVSLQQFYKSLPDERARVYEGGIQARFYPLGTFDHGLQVGGEIVYLTGSASTTGTIASPDDPSLTYTGALTAKGSGFKVGPFVGYKVALPVGLTLAAQIGIDYLSLKGIAKVENGTTRTGDQKTAFLLADAGVGWSF